MTDSRGKRNPKYDTDFETFVRAQLQDLPEMKTTLIEVKDTLWAMQVNQDIVDKR